MHHWIALLAGLSASTTPTTVTKTSLGASSTKTPFWQDPLQIRNLEDPPSSKFLSKIQEEPWRGGLEPIPIDGIPLHTAAVIEGKIPSDLNGMVCRNGPGRIRIGNSQYGHWFDGDGIISQLCLDGSTGTATFMAKYVETERFRIQQQKQKQQTKEDEEGGRSVPMATAGAWTKKGRGGLFENLFAIPTNPSNTNVLFLSSKENGTGSTSKQKKQPRMFAVAEGGDPIEMNSQTLQTIDTISFKSSKTGEKVQSAFAAHYKKDPITEEIYNHGMILSTKLAMNAMKLSKYGDLLQQTTHELPFVTFIHDSMISEDHFLLILQPYMAPMSSLMTSVMGGQPLGQQFKWNPSEMGNQSLVMVFSKDTMECIAKIPIPLLSSYHQIDAYYEDSTIDRSKISFRILSHQPSSVRDKLEDGFKDLYSNTKNPLCELWKYTIDLQSQSFVDSHRIAPTTAGLCELPTTNTDWKDYRKRYLWTNTRTEDVGHLNSLQKVDMETGECSDLITFGPTSFAGNPIFVPKPNALKEDDGYILSQIYRSDEHRSDVVILDAKTMEQLTILRLNSHITYQFHGEWHESPL